MLILIQALVIISLVELFKTISPTAKAFVSDHRLTGREEDMASN
jgi:hypothetical protein